MNLNYQFMIEDIPVVLSALPVTLALTFVSLFFALVVAVLFGACILKRIPLLRQLVVALNTFIKGVPLIVQLLFCYYALPYVLQMFDGFFGYEYNPRNPSYFGFAVVALAMNYGAYLTDVVVSSYRAVDRGQLEAAYSIGMSGLQAHVRIVIPQAVAISFPNLANYFMWLLKATSLASVVNVFELLATARASTAVNYAILEGYLVAAGIYWVVCILAERGLNLLSRRMNRYQKEPRAV
ncbi:MAG: amino acid ABC transporter permease [Clostridiales bacterium]|nr:amino acid ABC transporter permease [Clostridiales bacterium]